MQEGGQGVKGVLAVAGDGPAKDAEEPGQKNPLKVSRIVSGKLQQENAPTTQKIRYEFGLNRSNRSYIKHQAPVSYVQICTQCTILYITDTHSLLG